MPHFKKKDNNQDEITEQLREAGFSVQSTHTIGDGFPDLVVGKNGINIIVELKADEKKKLRKKQVDFFASWKGQAAKAFSFKGVVQAYNAHLQYLRITVATTPSVEIDNI